MSAFVVSKKHIDAIVSFLGAPPPPSKFSSSRTAAQQIYGSLAGKAPPSNEEAMRWIGQQLLRENVRSVNYRYGERDRVGKYEPPKPDGSLKAIAIAKLLECLDYQSCERRDYHRSLAYRINVTATAYVYKLVAMRSLDAAEEMERAPWSI